MSGIEGLIHDRFPEPFDICRAKPAEADLLSGRALAHYLPARSTDLNRHF